MEITFLGTSSGVPTRARNVSGVALRLPQRAELWLFDCGEGTQHQFLRSQLNLSNLTRVFITHMHGDHVYGLMGLLSTAGLGGHAQRVDLYGPPGLEEYVRACKQYSHTGFAYPLEIHTVESGRTVCEDEEFVVTCRLLRHRVPAFGYVVSERDRPGRFNVERARELGIPPGPLYGRLKRGESVTLADGRTVDGAELCEPPEDGRRVAYCTDTTYSEASVALARGADVLIHEATFAEEDAPLAAQSMHSTARDAARVAAEAGVRLLILTHLSPRYTPAAAVKPDDLLRQARAVFPDTVLAHDFMTYEVPRRRPTKGE
ncbi:MAG TPA: ribonuclease Z [Pyrinomonadaceae bacterium]|nr:ribonuclease Z [Pyrinomonadaceae bacterium]